MLRELSLDFETRSTLDRRRVGVYNYARHPTTDVWCMAWAFGADEPAIWLPGTPMPNDILTHVREGGMVRGWNVAFERVVWNLCLRRLDRSLPKLRRAQCYDTAADAAALALPRRLEDAARALGLDAQKDAAGARLMMQMARSRKPTRANPSPWWDDEARRTRLNEYCMQDVRTERAIAGVVPALPEYERRVYLLDQTINDRGMLLDMPLIEAARRMAQMVGQRANTRLAELTDGAVTGVTQTSAMLRWVQQYGLPIRNLRKDTVRGALTNTTALDPRVREVLLLRSDAAKSSVAKLKAMQEYACPDGRARGMLLYHGASTGRWSGKGIQPQNFPRGTVPQPEQYIDRIMAGDYAGIEVGHPVLSVISSLLRSMLIATPGHRFLAGDFAQIEARILAWLAQQDDLLHLFATGGAVYETMAAYIYGRDVSEIKTPSEERQIGKNVILGAGYGMGAETFAKQVHMQTGLRMSVGESRLAIATYRDVYPDIPRFWGDVERAAMNAVQSPDTVWAAGRRDSVRFQRKGEYLWCILPSGRMLAYMRPRLGSRTMSWTDYRGKPVVKTALSCEGVQSLTRKWVRQWTYGGHLVENIVQATARDIMASAMLRVEEAGYPVVLSVHDEIVADVPLRHGSVEEFEQLLSAVPQWAGDLPVAAEVWEGDRYRK